MMTGDHLSRPAPRGRYNGVLEIINFNRGFYAFTGLAIFCAMVGAMSLPANLALPVMATSLIALAWMLTSLLVSHYVYDRSSLHDLRWLIPTLSRTPRSWTNIHSGLDQTTAWLRTLFPDSYGRVLDIYDPSEVTEPSIARARRVYPRTVDSVASDFRALPLDDASCDAIFIIFAAHELRQRASRLLFFKQVTRILANDGTVVLVEHLRDLANGLAFGPGFFHFQSHREWLWVSREADLQVSREFSITPFVRVFVLNHFHVS